MKQLTNDDSWVINGFKPFSYLAFEYFTNCANHDSASKKLRTEIEANELLKNRLEANNYTRKTILLSPIQQQIIASTIGPPLITIKSAVQRK